MDAHPNARTTPHSQMRIVERLGEGWKFSAVEGDGEHSKHGPPMAGPGCGRG